MQVGVAGCQIAEESFVNQLFRISVDRFRFLSLFQLVRASAILLHCCSPLRIDNQEHVDWRCSRHFLAIRVDGWMERVLRRPFSLSFPLGCLLGGCPRFSLLQDLS